MTGEDFLVQVRAVLESHAVFQDMQVSDGILSCTAPHAPADAEYRLLFLEDTWQVLLVTPDRWLSQSIEADLMFTGENIEELLAEELDAVEYRGAPPRIHHYRSEDMLYTFRSPIDISMADAAGAAEIAALHLLAYEETFRDLGDMGETESP